jgi:hypothetical protein
MNENMPKNEEEFKKKLTPEQYNVLRQKGTEAPFSGKLVHPDKDGLYRCAACGNPLFRAEAKFDSGTGWPSFDRDQQRTPQPNHHITERDLGNRHAADTPDRPRCEHRRTIDHLNNERHPHPNNDEIKDHPAHGDKVDGVHVGSHSEG